MLNLVRHDEHEVESWASGYLILYAIVYPRYGYFYAFWEKADFSISRR